MLKLYTRSVFVSKIFLTVIFLSIASLPLLAGSGGGHTHRTLPAGTAPVLGTITFDGAPVLLQNSVASGTKSTNVLSSGLDVAVISTPSTDPVKLQITTGGGDEAAAPSPAPDGYIRGLRTTTTGSIQSLVFTSDDGSLFDLKKVAVSMSMLTNTDLGTVTITPYKAGVAGTAVTLSSVPDLTWQTSTANFEGIDEFIVSAVDNSGGFVGTIDIDDIVISAAPVVTTAAATAVVATTATLHGTVNDDFDPASTSFKYGTDPALAGAATAAGTPATTAGTGVAGPVTANLTGLTPNTKYYFEAVGTNNGGTGTGTILNFTTNPAITVTPASIPAATIGVAYSATFTASGGTAPYTYAVTAGALPAGVTLNSATGALSGTPTAGGSFPFTVTATDANSFSGTDAVTLTVNGPTITLSPTTLPDGTYGAAYSQTLTPSGGTAPYTYSISGGALPPGLTLSSGTGVLSGTVTAAGTYNFTVQATDASTGTGGPYSGSRLYTVVIDKASLTITADDQSKIYGSALPTLTATYTGLVNGDNAASLTTLPTLTTTATAASAVGSYPITASVAVDNNYTISYVAGTLTVTPAPLTIIVDNQTKTYGSALPTLTASYTGLVNGDNAASLTTPPTLTTTATAASAVGSYPITASGAVDNNYTISYVAGTLTVTPAPLTITADNQSKTYGSALPTLTVSYTGFVNGDTQGSLTTPPTITTTATSASPTGSYTITPSGAVDNNYTITYVNGTLTIGQASLTITADDQSSTYGSALPALTVSYTGFVNGDTQASLTTAATASTTATADSPAGTYTITPSGAVDNNYAITYVNGTLTIGQAPLTVTADNQSSTYGSAIPALTVSYSGLVNGDTQASLTTAATASTTATAASPAGSYTITPSGAVDNNYAITYVNGTLTIGQAPLTITADNQSSTYGSAIPALTVSYSGLVNGDTQASLTTAATASTTATAASPAGSYTITPSGAVDNNYVITYVSGTLTIGQAPLTITADDQSSTYGSALPALTVSYTGFVNGDTQASLTTGATASTTATAASPAGSYTITPSGAVDNNYVITYVSGTLTIGQAPLTITADNQSMTYGSALPTLTASYTGFVNGDTPGSLTTPATLSTTATSSSPVGTYPITASGAVDNNYAITYVAGTLTIGQAPLTITADNQSSTYGSALPVLTASYSGFVNGDNAASLTTAPTLSTTATAASPVGTYPITVSGAVDNNYAITYVAGTLTIGQAPLTITADNQSSTYGSALPALTASYSGFVNGDNAASLTTAPTLSTTATAASPVGTYPITASGAVDNNYAITYVAGTLTIGQAPLTITADNQSSTYGSALPTLTASYSGFVNGDNAASLTTAPTLTTTGTSGSPVGTYPITASGAVDNNYAITYLSGTLTIGQAPLTITADNQSSTYGGAIPTLTASYTGFVNGDNATSLTTAPTITTTGTSGSPVGTYPITASGAVDNNYAITYVGGTLTIGKAALTITADNQSSTYGGAIPALTASYSGFVNGDNAASLTTAPTLSTTATAASPVGTYPITASGAADNNYTITYVVGTLTIGKATLTITADNQSSTYGSAIPVLTATYSGFVNGDNAASLTTAPNITTTATSLSLAGIYPITASGAVDDNYTITYVGGLLTIGKASLTITAAPQTRTYGDPNPTLTATYTGFVNTDNAASLTTQPTLTTTATVSSPVGTYPITVSGATDDNYFITYVSGTLTVTPATLTITANDQSRVLQIPNPTLTVSYSGFVNGEGVSVITTAPTVSTTATINSPAGMYPITASGAVAPNYTIVYVNGTLTILQQAPNAISFGTLPTKTYGDADFVISASASSGLPVSFSSGDNTIATVSQNGAGDWVVHIVSAGQVTITAIQAGNANYVAATPVDEVLTINKADQSIVFPSIGSSIATIGSVIALHASASSGLPITYSVSDPTLATVSGNQLTITAAGTVIVTASQPGNTDYNAAQPVTDTLQLFNGSSFKSHIGVFPNPAHGTMHIRFSSDYIVTSLIMFDMRGRIVLGVDQVAGGSDDIPVNVNSLMPGIYMLRVVCLRNNEIVFPAFKIEIQ